MNVAHDHNGADKIHRLWPPVSQPSTALTEAELVSLYTPVSATNLRANFVASADGATAVAGRSAGLSSPSDRKVLRILRDLCDAVLVGAGTARQENYDSLTPSQARQTARQARGLTAVPRLVVFSRRLDLDPLSKMFTEAPLPPIIITCETAPHTQKSQLSKVAEILDVGEHDVDLPMAISELHRRGLTKLLCEGGPHLLGGLIADNLLDELCLTLSPWLTGAEGGRLSAGERYVKIPQKLILKHVLNYDGNLFLRYCRVNSDSLNE